MLPYVKLFPDAGDTVDLLSDDEAGRLLKAILHYAAGREVALPGQERLVFSMLRSQMDRDEANYRSFEEKQRENGSRGGRPKSALPRKERDAAPEEAQPARRAKKPTAPKAPAENPPVFADTLKNPPVFAQASENPPVFTDTPKNPPVFTQASENPPVFTDTLKNPPVFADTPKNPPVFVCTVENPPVSEEDKEKDEERDEDEEAAPPEEAACAPARGEKHTPAAAMVKRYIRPMTDRAWEELHVFLDELPEEVIVWAVEDACSHGATSWAYLKKVLDGMLTGGVRTVAGAEARSAAARASPGKRGFQGPKPYVNPFDDMLKGAKG